MGFSDFFKARRQTPPETLNIPEPPQDSEPQSAPASQDEATSPSTEPGVSSAVKALLNQKNELGYSETIAALVNLGTPAVPDLIEVVRTDSGNLTIAGKAIAGIGGTTAITPLFQELSGINGTTKAEQVAYTLAQLVDATDAQMFIDLLTQTKEWSSRAGASIVLGALADRVDDALPRDHIVEALLETFQEDSTTSRMSTPGVGQAHLEERGLLDPSGSVRAGCRRHRTGHRGGRLRHRCRGPGGDGECAGRQDDAGCDRRPHRTRGRAAVLHVVHREVGSDPGQTTGGNQGGLRRRRPPGIPQSPAEMGRLLRLVPACLRGLHDDRMGPGQTIR